MSWVVVKYEKMRFLATLSRATFRISLSKGSAIGTLLNVTLLAYASDEKLYFAPGIFPNKAKRNRAGDGKLLNFNVGLIDLQKKQS